MIGIRAVFQPGILAETRRVTRALVRGVGQATAQFKLGVAFEYGKGGPKDVAAAIEWYRLAATQGVEPARDALKRLGALD